MCLFHRPRRNLKRALEGTRGARRAPRLRPPPPRRGAAARARRCRASRRASQGARAAARSPRRSGSRPCLGARPARARFAPAAAPRGSGAPRRQGRGRLGKGPARLRCQTPVLQTLEKKPVRWRRGKGDSRKGTAREVFHARNPVRVFPTVLGIPLLSFLLSPFSSLLLWKAVHQRPPGNTPHPYPVTGSGNGQRRNGRPER